MIPSVLSDEFEPDSVLSRYGLCNTTSDKRFDNITSMAAAVCSTPHSRIAFIDPDQHYIKSHYGDSLCDETHELNFCQHTMSSEKSVFIVDDAKSDIRFAKCQMVVEQGIVFYAGVTLSSSEGHKLGVLSVYDKKTNGFGPEQQAALLQLAAHVESLVDQRYLTARLAETEELLKSAQLKLEQQITEQGEFVSVVAHDLKSPLVKIARVSEILAEDYKSALDEEGQNWLLMLNNAAQAAGKQIDELLSANQV